MKVAGKLRVKPKKLVNQAIFELNKIENLENCTIEWPKILKNWFEVGPAHRRCMIREQVIPYLHVNFSEKPDQLVKCKFSEFSESKNAKENLKKDFLKTIDSFKAQAAQAEKCGDTQKLELILIATHAAQKKYQMELR